MKRPGHAAPSALLGAALPLAALPLAVLPLAVLPLAVLPLGPLVVAGLTLAPLPLAAQQARVAASGAPRSSAPTGGSASSSAVPPGVRQMVAGVGQVAPGVREGPPAGPGASPVLTPEALSSLHFRLVGPARSTGRVVDLALDPRNHHVWYLAAASGGVWKTTNDGLEWTPVFDDQGSYSIGTVVVDPNLPDRVWVGTGENNAQRSVSFGDGVYRSDDGGDTWRRMGLEDSEHVGRIVIRPDDSDVVYVAAQGPLWSDGGDRGLYRTRDGGETWERILHVSEMTGISDVVMDPTDPDVLYASSYQRRRHTGILIGGGPESTVFKSEDGGETWREIDQGLPGVDRGRIGLAVSPQRHEVVYAVVAAASDSSGFYRSEDAGEHWTRMSDWAPGDPQYYQELFPSPFEFDVVYGVAVRLMKTTDGGRTFEAVEGGFHVDQHHVGFDPDDPRRLFVGNDGGLYESVDGGATFRHFDNLPITQFYRVATDDAVPFYHIAGGAQDNGSQMGPQQTRARAGVYNALWGSIGGGDGFVSRFDPFDPAYVYSESQNGRIQRVDLVADETTSVSPEEEEGEETRWYWDTPVVTSVHAPGRLYIASDRVYRTENRGDDWTAISGDLTRHLDRDTMEVMGRVWPEDAVWKHVFTSPLSTVVSLSESPIDADLLVVGTDDGLVQVTEDGGANWRRAAAVPGVPELAYVADVHASRHDPDVLYAVFNNHKRGDFRPYVARSADRGRTWTLVTTGIARRDPLWAIEEDDEDPDLLFLGAEFGLYVSPDGGGRWIPFDGGLPVIQVRDLQVQEREDDLVLATFGRGFWVFDDISFLREAGQVGPESGAYLFPVKDATSYNFQVGAGGPGSGDFSAPNPPYGVPLTVWTDPDDRGSDSLTVVIREAGSRRELDRVSLGEDAGGLQRVVWDLTEAPPEDTGRGGRGGGGGGRGGGGRGRGRSGPPVRSGFFEAAVVRAPEGGADTVLTEWRTFRVLPLEVGGR